MSDNQQALEQAYTLIEGQKLGEARQLLDKVLATDKNSADAWWLYAHAVEDPKEAVTALENVTRLDPNHVEAKSLLQSARQKVATTAPSDDDFELYFDDESDQPEAGDEPDTRRRSFIIFGAILALVAFGVIILLFSPKQQPATPATESTGTFVSQNVDTSALTQTAQVVVVESTTVVLQSTELTATAPTEQSVILPSDTNTTEAPQVDIAFTTATPSAMTVITPDDTLQPSVENFLASLVTQYPTNGATETIDTIIGATLLVTMCTSRGDTHNQLVPNAMTGLSQSIDLLPTDYVGVGVRFLQCDTNETINVMIMPRQSALEYKNADLSEQDFRRSWRVVDA